MVVGFTTTYAIGAYHHWCCEFEYRSGRGAQHYVIKFVSDFDRLVVFFGSCGFLHQYNWLPYTRYNWNIVSSGVRHHQANKQLCQYFIHIVAVIDTKIYLDVVNIAWRRYEILNMYWDTSLWVIKRSLNIPKA